MNTIQALSLTRTTYRVADFLSWQRSGNLELRPPFQRGSVWSQKAKSFFIDTLVRGYPVPLIFIQDRTDQKTYEPKRLVVDGQQRLRTVLAFVEPKCLSDRQEGDKFTVLAMHNPDIAGLSFQDLAQDVRERILNFQFSVNVLPSTTPGAALLEIFARMNATGTRLNDQELRNAGYAGAFKQTAYALAYAELDNWMAWGIFTNMQLARMAEVELTSEILMLLINGPRGKSQPAITKVYTEYDDDFPFAKAARRRFLHIFEGLASIYARSSDDAIRPFRSQSWFYTLFSFAHNCCFADYLAQKRSGSPRRVDWETVRSHVVRRARALEREQDLQPDLVKALRGASTDKGSREQRHRFIARGWRDA